MNSPPPRAPTATKSPKPGDLLSPEESKRLEEQALTAWKQDDRAGWSDLTTIPLGTKVALSLYVNYQARKDNLPMDDPNVKNITHLRFHTKMM